MSAHTAPMLRAIGGYHLLLPIGTGGMGTVFLAEREIVVGVKRQFAVKVLHAATLAEPEAASLLLEEARLAAQITHPHVVRVYEAGARPEGVFMAMEYIEGTTLSVLIREAARTGVTTPLGAVGRILSDALSGLHAAHEARDTDGRLLGLIHRDFSPQNILVGHDGTSSLTDFGIAKVLGQTHHTTTGLVKGKIGYMAPEQALGQPLDRRCDVWAAGVVLWEAVTARRLFQASTDAAAILRIVSKDPLPKPSEVRAGLGPELDPIVRAALAREPARRIRSAGELRDRLEAAWEAFGGLASRAEVADWVERVAGATSSAIRAKVVAARASSGADGLDPAARIGGAGAAIEEKRTDAVSVSGIQAGGRQPRRTVALVVGAAAALAGIGWMISRDGLTTDEGSPAQSSAERAPASEAAVASSESIASPEGETATPIATHLRITANEPVAQVKLGARSIAFAEPSAEIEIELTEAERESTLVLVAISIDKQRIAIDVDTRTGRAEITFGPATARTPAPKKPWPAPVKPPKPKGAEPGIVSDPYGQN
jgi:eukaryotic-like serine/threonine-protein kinase